MKKEIVCHLCDYTTDRQHNYESHLLTSKHIKNVNNSNDNNNLLSVCEYCHKNITRLRNLKNHQMICKEKKKYDSEQKNILKTNKTIILEKKELNDKIQQLTNKNEKLQQQKDDIMEEYNNYLKFVGEKSLDIVSHSNVQKLTYNIHYVMNNCNDAYDFMELMRQPLTQIEIDDLLDNSPVIGCYNLLYSRCVDNLEFYDRPIHSLDISRHKFCVNIGGVWKVDFNGKHIISVVIDKVKDIYVKNLDGIKSGKDKYLELYNNRYKVLDYLEDHIMIKNEMPKKQSIDKKSIKRITTKKTNKQIIKSSKKQVSKKRSLLEISDDDLLSDSFDESTKQKTTKLSKRRLSFEIFNDDSSSESIVKSTKLSKRRLSFEIFNDDSSSESIVKSNVKQTIQNDY
jgi:hypothetical protein